LVDEVAVGALQGQGFGGEGAGGGDGAGVFVPYGVKSGRGQGMFFATDALYFGGPGVGIKLGRGEERVAGLFDGLIHSQPVLQCVLGLLLAGSKLH
jgi:hypothetical protein